VHDTQGGGTFELIELGDAADGPNLISSPNMEGGAFPSFVYAACASYDAGAACTIGSQGGSVQARARVRACSCVRVHEQGDDAPTAPAAHLSPVCISRTDACQRPCTGSGVPHTRLFASHATHRPHLLSSALHHRS